VDVADLVHARGAREGVRGGARKGVALMRRWLAAPPVHFVLLGSLVFALHAARPAARAGEPGAAPRLATDAELLEREARRLGLELDDSGIQRRLVRNLRFVGEGAAGDAAADFEEALALGLDRSDRVVRRRLVQRLELQAHAWARASEPTSAELAALLARESERFALPERTRLSHVFLSRDRHADGLAAADAALVKRLAALAPERAAELGDPFLLGNQLAPRTRAELAASFGEAFASAATALPPGRWSGPIASSYGLHRVFVHERIPARAARLAEVRDAVREAVFAERAQRVLADWLRELRSEAS
jgi:hypothetical protein